MNKHFRLPILVVGIVVIIILFLGYCSYIHIRNVFDQMYFSRVYTDSIFSKFKNHRYLFENMPQLQSPSHDADSNAIWLGNILFECYDSNFLENGHKIMFCFDMTDHMLYIDYTIDTKAGQEWYEYIYNVDEKLLTYKTSNPENVDMKSFLFTIVLRDWFTANGPKTHFSLENLGDYTFVDTTE